MGVRQKLLAGLVTLLVAYGAVVGNFAYKQRDYIYPGAGQHLDKQKSFAGFDDIRLHTDDGLSLRALYAPAKGERRTAVFFHGNGDSLSGAIEATKRLRAAGLGLLLVEYRGYGGNPGAPSEQGLYRDGEAALAWLAKQGITSSQIVLIGNSLGSGTATELAKRHKVSALVIVSGFTSLTDVAASSLPFLPVSILLADHFDNRSKLQKLAMPVLVLHGQHDNVIAFEHGKRLGTAAKNGRFVAVPDIGHELAYLPETQDEILRWIEQLPNP